MADDAFALSPISARASLPSEEDYEAISEAFMETSRGRWFLGEYAKRNRNADTRMVLDAVARIEQTIAAQRQPATDSGAAEALVAISRAVEQARRAGSAAFDSLALEENLAPIRKGARVIKEIAWRWREIGADGRICDLLDSQVSAIEGACEQLSSTGAREALNAAFDLVEQQIAALGERDGAVPPAADEPPARSPSPAPSVAMPVAIAEAAPEATAAAEPEAAMRGEALPAETVAEAAEAVDITSEAAAVAAEVEEITAEAADARDEALLEMVAREMGAPDPYDDEDVADEEDASYAHAQQAPVAGLPTADPIVVAREPEPMPEPATQPPAVPPPAQAAPEPSLEPSLGSSLIASGIVRRPNASAASDPLAPIRRLSQAEKIALFS